MVEICIPKERNSARLFFKLLQIETLHKSNKNYLNTRPKNPQAYNKLTRPFNFSTKYRQFKIKFSKDCNENK